LECPQPGAVEIEPRPPAALPKMELNSCGEGRIYLPTQHRAPFISSFMTLPWLPCKTSRLPPFDVESQGCWIKSRTPSCGPPRFPNSRPVPVGDPTLWCKLRLVFASPDFPRLGGSELLEVNLRIAEQKHMSSIQP